MCNTARKLDRKYLHNVHLHRESLSQDLGEGARELERAREVANPKCLRIAD